MTRLIREIPTRRQVELKVDGRAVSVPEGATLLDACRQAGADVPTLCFLENLTPVNVCRVCVVEVEGARVLAPPARAARSPAWWCEPTPSACASRGGW
jgi:NADP-reducing hydrogenase subunit HndD